MSKYQEALDAGYSDEEVRAFMQPKIDEARSAGYSDDEINTHLGIEVSKFTPAELDTQPNSAQTYIDTYVQPAESNVSTSTEEYEPNAAPAQELFNAMPQQSDNGLEQFGAGIRQGVTLPILKVVEDTLGIEGIADTELKIVKEGIAKYNKQHPFQIIHPSTVGRLLSQSVVPIMKTKGAVAATEGLINALDGIGQNGTYNNVAEDAAIGAAFGFGGSWVVEAMTGLNKAEKINLASIAKNNPQEAQDLVDTLMFARDNGIPIPKDVWRSGTTVKTGNAFMDAKIVSIKENLKGVEYETMSKLSDNIVSGKVTSGEASADFSKAMNAKYDEMLNISTSKWEAYANLAGEAQISKAGQKQIMLDLDKALDNADSTVKNFISRTLFKNKEDGTLLVKNLDEEAKVLKNRLNSYPVNVSNKEKAARKRIEGLLRSKLREIARAEKDLINKPLELADLVEAKKAINNKMYVKGGSISTGNKLEKKHLKKANEILDKYIADMSSPEALQALEEARLASKNTFDTFGYNLSGTNMNKVLDTSGKIIGQQDVATIREFEKELLDSDVDVALSKFKKYEQLLGSPESLDKAKKLYVNKVFGLDMDKIVAESTSQTGLKLDDIALDKGLAKVLDSEASRRLAKHIYGEDGFKQLVALKRLNGIIKKKVPGDTSSWTKEAMSGYSSSLGGIALGTAKLLKSATWDVLTYPFYRKGQKFNTAQINKLLNELDGASGSKFKEVLGKINHEIKDTLYKGASSLGKQ